MTGSKLLIVPTPIGNLQDMTFRAIEVLKSVDTVLAEDTRTTSNLLRHFGIEVNKLQSHHKFNEFKTVDHLVERLKAGESIALVSDAGTPAISDPGHMLVKKCIESGVEVEVLPGATAFVPALVLSGFSTEKFVFEGFLPHKKGRQKRLKQLAAEERTIIFYESPYRVVKLLKELQEHFGADRRVSVSRELTKKFEETIRGTVQEVLNHFEQKQPKGEFVVVVEGAK